MSRRASLKIVGCLMALATCTAAAEAQVINDLLQKKKVEDDRRRLEQDTKAAQQAAQLDVIGLKIGMPFAEAEKLVRAYMTVDRVITFERPAIIAADTKIRPYASGLLFIDAEGRETITLFNEPPAAPGTLVALMRTLTKEPGEMPGLPLLNSLREKYGQEARLKAEGAAFEAVWTPPASAQAAAPTLQTCIDAADRVSPYDIPMTENGFERPLGRDKAGTWIMNRDPRQKPFQQGMTWNWPKTPPFFADQAPKKRNFVCLPTLFVIYNNYNQIDQLNVSLVDHEMYLPLFKQSELALRKSGGRVAPTERSGVKL